MRKKLQEAIYTMIRASERTLDDMDWCFVCSSHGRNHSENEGCAANIARAEMEHATKGTALVGTINAGEVTIADTITGSIKM